VGAKSARERGRRMDRLPRRGTDRLEDAVAWLLIAAGLLAVVLIGSLTAAVHRAGMERAAVETTERHQVPAALVASAGLYKTQVGPLPVARSAPVPVMPGQPRTAAGRPVMVWVDAHGQPTRPPTTPAGAVQAAVAVAVGLSVVALLALAGIWTGVRTVTARLNDARWEREWARVGPRWSRRVH
jgi:hypothetical protein